MPWPQIFVRISGHEDSVHETFQCLVELATVCGSQMQTRQRYKARVHGPRQYGAARCAVLGPSRQSYKSALFAKAKLRNGHFSQFEFLYFSGGRHWQLHVASDVPRYFE